MIGHCMVSSRAASVNAERGGPLQEWWHALGTPTREKKVTRITLLNKYSKRQMSSAGYVSVTVTTR
jgi:hypothetical protein